MCGLVGVAGSIDNGGRKAFHHLLWIDAIRGGDGTGIYVVECGKNPTTHLVKEAGTPDRLFDKKTYLEAHDTRCVLMMGHNRARTVGTNSWKNAHPFEFDNIVGAHNGTLMLSSLKKLPDNESFETDSEAIFNCIEEKGVEKTIPLLSGAWALSWWNKKERTINLLRNDTRTLFWAMDKSHKMLFWASEIAMLYLAFNHNNQVSFDAKDVHALQPNIHYKFNISDTHGEIIAKPIKVERKGFFIEPTKGTYKHFFHRGEPAKTGDYNSMWESRVKPTIVTPYTPLSPDEIARRELRREKTEEVYKNGGEITGDHPPVKLSYLHTPKKESKLNPYYLGYAAFHILYRKEFEQMVGRGCANCSSIPQWGEPFKPLSDGTFLCSDCVINNPENILLACGGLL